MRSITQIGASGFSTCALFDNGNLRCWGHDFTGVLGQGHANSIGDGPGEMPPGTVSLGNTVVVLSKGPGLHSCVVLLDTTVRCWDEAACGQLGYGSQVIIGDSNNEMPPAPVQAY